MSKAETFRVLVQQRLTAAAQEISELFERTIAEYELELRRQRKQTILDAVFSPEVRLHRADVEQLLGSEAPPEQQDWSPSLDQQDPAELPHITEEQQPDEAENTSVTFTDEEESSQLHHSQTEADTEDCGGAEFHADSDLQPAAHDDASQSPEPDERRVDETREAQSGLNSLEKEPLLSTDTEMKRKDEQQTAASMKTKMAAASSSDDEDSDVEKNFALLTERGGGGRGAEEGEGRHGGEEKEEEFSDDDDEQGSEDEEGSESGDEESDDDEEEEEEQVEGDGESRPSDEEEEEEEEEDGDDDDEEDPEAPGGSSEIQTREDIKKELSNMSFEDILKLQNKVGTKVYNEVAYGSDKTANNAKKKRLNKNRPMEISAKRAAPFLRQVVAVRKPTFRDPRFDDLSGEYKPEIFEKTYKFINDIKHREKEVVQQQLKKTKKNNQRKEKLQFLLKRMENQERARQSREQQRERELQFKRQQRERANQGARPFFLKNSEKKKLQLAEKYQELKKSGKLENFLSKKRKRNAVKDRRKLPKQLQSKKAA